MKKKLLGLILLFLSCSYNAGSHIHTDDPRLTLDSRLCPSGRKLLDDRDSEDLHERQTIAHARLFAAIAVRCLSRRQALH